MFQGALLTEMLPVIAAMFVALGTFGTGLGAAVHYGLRSEGGATALSAARAVGKPLAARSLPFGVAGLAFLLGFGVLSLLPLAGLAAHTAYRHFSA